MARLKQRGVLSPLRRDNAAGYEVTDFGRHVFVRGDRHIFDTAGMQEGDLWCVASVTIPESHRSVRTRMRKLLTQIGCGQIASSLWIVPGHHRDEVEEILSGLEAASSTVLFMAEEPITRIPLRDSVAQWWDLPAIRAAHDAFLAVVEACGAAQGAGGSFRNYVAIVDAWRPVPYIDPGLPDTLMPTGWLGRESREAFQLASSALADGAWEHVTSVLMIGVDVPVVTAALLILSALLFSRGPHRMLSLHRGISAVAMGCVALTMHSSMSPTPAGGHVHGGATPTQLLAVTWSCVLAATVTTVISLARTPDGDDRRGRPVRSTPSHDAEIPDISRVPLASRTPGTARHTPASVARSAATTSPTCASAGLSREKAVAGGVRARSTSTTV